jgi:hypothetical protein
MMAYQTDGAIAVVSRVGMVVEHRDKGGYKEQQYEKCGKTPVPIHSVPLTIMHRLISGSEFVKLLLIAC